MGVPTTFFADLICPYCFLAAAPLGRLRAERAIELRLVPFEIHPETPREGVLLEAFGAAKVDALYRELGWLAQDAGIRLLKPDRLANSRLALEGVEMARQAGGEAGALDFAGRVYAAYFQKGQDIGREDVLREIARGAGIGRDLQDKCFLVRGFGAAVDAAKREAEDALVSAVPAAHVGGHPVVGYKPYSEMRRVVEKVAGRMR